MFVIQYRKVLYAIAGVTVGLSIASVAFFGLNLGIDFTGGTLVEARYSAQVPTLSTLSDAIRETGVESFSLRTADDDGYILRAAPISIEEAEVLREAFSIGGTHEVSIERFTEIGPTMGRELRNKGLLAIALVIVSIVLYIAFVFRKVSDGFPEGTRGVSSWTYSGLAILALVHDIIIPTGLMAALGFFFGAQVDALFIMALLVILGYSINDTIIIFDRVRENLLVNQEKKIREDFQVTAGRSLGQSFTRSVNTSVTTIIVLVALFLLGPTATKDFALILMTGILAGTYSSIALALPLLVTIERYYAKRPKKV